MRTVSVLVLMGLYDHRIRQGIGRFALEHDWHLTIIDGCTHGRAIPQNWSGDGILTQIGTSPELDSYLRTQSIPCVDMWIAHPHIPMPRVSGDQLLIGRVAAAHLLEHGFSHTAYFSTEYNLLHRMRYEGFTAGMTAAGCPTPLNLAWALHSNGASDDWQAQNIWLRNALKPLPKPLGVFCYSDYDGAKIETICLDAGYQVPAEIAILGVDNDPLVCENLRIPLSSVRHDLFRVGYEGAALLNRLMQGERIPPEPLLIPPRGVEVRASTDSFVAADPTIAAAINYMQEHIGSSMGVEQVAAALLLSSARLQALFREQTGQPVHATLSRLRLLRARRLLSDTQLTVKEVAAASGFCHAQHMNSIFRRELQLTPSEYREQEHQSRASSTATMGERL